MKTSQFTLLILICFGFCIISFAQTKPVALKFDEFSDKEVSDREIKSARLKRFAWQLKKYPQMQAVIIGYDGRKQSLASNYWTGDNSILALQREIEGEGIPEKRFIRIVGGLREHSAYELWLLPKGAETPQPKPEISQSDIIYCLDNLEIIGTDAIFDKNKLQEFSANVAPGRMESKLVYDWEISTGKIVEGHGTSKIKLDVSETKENYLVVRLSVKGIALECENQYVKSIIFVKYPFKFAEFPDRGENLKWYPLDFSSELSKNSQLEGKIFIYGARGVGAKSIAFGEIRLRMFFKFMNALLDNISIESGGYRENQTFEMWLYPKGSEPPKPTPTVDEKFVILKRKPSKPK